MTNEKPNLATSPGRPSFSQIVVPFLFLPIGAIIGWIIDGFYQVSYKQCGQLLYIPFHQDAYDILYNLHVSSLLFWGLLSGLLIVVFLAALKSPALKIWVLFCALTPIVILSGIVALRSTNASNARLRLDKVYITLNGLFEDKDEISIDITSDIALKSKFVKMGFQNTRWVDRCNSVDGHLVYVLPQEYFALGAGERGYYYSEDDQVPVFTDERKILRHYHIYGNWYRYWAR